MTFSKISYGGALGQQSFNVLDVDVVRKVAIGTTIRGYSDTFGEGTFIYLPGAAGVVAGDLVAYDMLPSNPTVTRLIAGAGVNNSGRPVAVALTAIPAGQFGWYQIRGVAVVNAIVGTAVGNLFASGTTGSATSVAAAGAQILGARISSAVGTPSAGRSFITINTPCMQSQIT